MLGRLPVEAIPDSSRAPVSAINYGTKTREKETSDIHNMYTMYIMFQIVNRQHWVNMGPSQLTRN